MSRSMMSSLCLILTAVSVALPIQSGLAQTPGDTNQVEITWGVKVPMRDGVRLNATVYRPKGVTESLPTILGFTPYIGDVYHARAVYFAKHGYVFTTVDVRGRGNSEGGFEPFRNEGRDGHDVVEWIARQPWSDGQVAMFGGSYGGFDQWSTLKELPPHLTTIIPAAAAYPGRDFPFVNNVFMSYNITWLTLTSGVTGNNRFFGDQEYWIGRYRDRYLEHLPFKSLDSIAGNSTTHFQTWLEHPTPDAYWDAMVPSPDQLRQIDAPILTITGHYDGDQRGAIEHYRQHMKYGNPQAKALHYLVIGPWNHGGTSLAVKQVGGLEFGDSALIDLDELRTDWYNWHMTGGTRPEFLKGRVAYYVAGADQWKYADDLDAVTTGRRTMYLDSQDGRPTSVFHSGTLSPELPSRTTADEYVYDPLDTSPAELEKAGSGNALSYVFWGEQPLNETFVVNIDGDGLVYHTAPFESPTELAGFVKLVAWMSLDVPDTDFMVTLYEITGDGRSILLTADLMRARYRESRREATLLRPGEITRFEFDNFQFFSRRVAKGSRLRLVIDSPNSIHFQKNYNSGGVVAEESGADARTATIRLYHDPEHPSFLEIPIVRDVT